MLEYFLFNFQALFLIIVRVTSMLMFIPVFRGMEVPMTVKTGFSTFIALITLPYVVESGWTFDSSTTFSYFASIFNEIIIGATIGFIVYMLFTVFILSGQYYSMQIGFGIVNTFDPLSQTSIPIIGQFQNIIAMFIFIMLRAHSYLVIAVISSYKRFPQYSMNAFLFSVENMVNYFAQAFYIALVLAIPIMGALLILSLILGLLGKVAPQMNLMVLGFPLKIIVGLGTLTILEPILYTISENIIQRILTEVHNFLMLVGRV